MARKKGPTKTGQMAAQIEPSRKAAGRVDEFRDRAQRIAAREQVVPPRLLAGQATREHVRSTLREDHATRISVVPFSTSRPRIRAEVLALTL